MASTTRPTPRRIEVPAMGAEDVVVDEHGIAWTGSPLSAFEELETVTNQIEFARAAFGAGIPCFGSCWGLQVMAVALGGRVHRHPGGPEIGISRRVGLTDAQMNRLMPINQRFETQRRAIQRQERETRLSLRDAMRDSTHADQARITSYLDKLVDLQRQRVELVAQEQRDLAAFMTPLQRARYTALQEQVRRRIEQMARQNRTPADTTLGAPPAH